jgi:hypothetical protein
MWRAVFRFGATCPRKIDDGRVSAADENAYALARLRFVAAGKDCRKCGGAAGFRKDAQDLPECLLGLLYGVVGNEYRVADKFLRDRKHKLADAFWGQ